MFTMKWRESWLLEKQERTNKARLTGYARIVFLLWKAVLAILAHKKEKVWHIQDKCRMETCTAIILRPEETAAWQTWVCS